MTIVATSLVQEIWKLRCAKHTPTSGRKVLAQYGATMDNIIDETLFVTDMNTAFAAAVKCREHVFFGVPVVASTIVQVESYIP
jgi:enamine deaminase RidA (YjgF/YER057c/UK114 family)